MLHKNYSTLQQHPSTAFSHQHRQNRSTIDMYQTAKASNSTFDRPNTSFLIVHRLNTASQRKEVLFADQTEIQSAEHDLEAAFPHDLNNYLQKKFRNFLIRKHDSNPAKPTVVAVQNPELLNTFCSKMEVSCMLDKEREFSQKKTRPYKTIQAAYLTNAKERIKRLVQLKRQKQANYNQLRQTIRQKCKRKERGFAVIGPHVLNTEKDKQLGQKIKIQFQHQIQRYKERISSKLRIKSLRKNERLIEQE